MLKVKPTKIRGQRGSLIFYLRWILFLIVENRRRNTCECPCGFFF